tara:strand:- start:830 stop:1666 length:837 start_codon:yes stop_codon:yes gene_type:complete
MSQTFVNEWCVREFVFNPDGEFIGEVAQRRHLRDLGDSRIEVVQDCEPEARLNDSIMSSFSGRFKFDLKLDGERRIYLGPDVFGEGVSVCDQVMVGSGIWPHFGYNFKSYALVNKNGVQLTGGQFYNGPALQAVIIGVAAPKLPVHGIADIILKPVDLGGVYEGVARSVDPGGKLLWEGACSRRGEVNGAGFCESIGDRSWFTAYREAEGRCFLEHYGYHCVVKTYGSSRYRQGYKAGNSYILQEFVDPMTDDLHVVGSFFKNEVLSYRLVAKLKKII